MSDADEDVNANGNLDDYDSDCDAVSNYRKKGAVENDGCPVIDTDTGTGVDLETMIDTETSVKADTDSDSTAEFDTNSDSPEKLVLIQVTKLIRNQMIAAVLLPSKLESCPCFTCCCPFLSDRAN